MILMAMDKRPRCDAQSIILMALDRSASRTRDHDGHLHVALSHLTKANVCPYFGSEIPGWQELGLDASRIYNLLRDPEELAKAVDTYNGKPLLIRHKPVNARAHPKDLVVGTTGTNATWNPPYIDNSLTVWDGLAIDGIDLNKKRELSAGYHYTPDMTPGIFEGMQYDGIMRNVRCNHIALVIEGRAGPDVLVGDEVMKTNSRAALMVSGAIAGYVRPRLAKDAAIDMTADLAGINAAALAMDGAPLALAKKIIATATPQLAEGQTIAEDELAGVISTAVDWSNEGIASDEIPEPLKIEPKPKVEPKTEPKQEPAMDAATVDAKIAEASKLAHDKAMAEGAAIRTAEKAVAPFVGELAAMDSAAAIYKVGLDHFKVALDGLPEAAYAATFNAVAKANKEAPKVAQDHRGPGKLSSIVPNLQPAKVL